MWEICTLGELSHVIFLSIEHFSPVGSFPYPCVSSEKLLSYLRRGNRLSCPDNCSVDLSVICFVNYGRLFIAMFLQVRDDVCMLARRY